MFEHGKPWGLYLDIFAHNVYVIGCLHHFIQPDDVRVHEETQDLYLSPHCNEKQQVKQLSPFCKD